MRFPAFKADHAALSDYYLVPRRDVLTLDDVVDLAEDLLGHFKTGRVCWECGTPESDLCELECHVGQLRAAIQSLGMSVDAMANMDPVVQLHVSDV